jgi:hypothetical protein
VPISTLHSVRGENIQSSSLPSGVSASPSAELLEDADFVTSVEPVESDFVCSRVPSEDALALINKAKLSGYGRKIEDSGKKLAQWFQPFQNSDSSNPKFKSDSKVFVFIPHVTHPEFMPRTEGPNARPFYPCINFGYDPSHNVKLNDWPEDPPRCIMDDQTVLLLGRVLKCTKCEALSKEAKADGRDVNLQYTFRTYSAKLLPHYPFEISSGFPFVKTSDSDRALYVCKNVVEDMLYLRTEGGSNVDAFVELLRRKVLMI